MEEQNLFTSRFTLFFVCVSFVTFFCVNYVHTIIVNNICIEEKTLNRTQQNTRHIWKVRPCHNESYIFGFQTDVKTIIMFTVLHNTLCAVCLLSVLFCSHCDLYVRQAQIRSGPITKALHIVYMRVSHISCCSVW